jgi:hypothetical protein
MAVLSVDLAFRRWSDLGVVLLERAQAVPVRDAATLGPLGLPLKPTFGATKSGNILAAPELAEGTISCEILRWDDLGPVDPENLAGRLNHICATRNVKILMLDGPQAWKSSSNGLEFSRVSERQLNKPSKTGLPGMVKPLSSRPFAEYCLDVYDALCRRGWHRLQTRTQPVTSPERVLVESYPQAAWKSLGIKPLPSKRRAKVSDLAEAYAALRSLMPITTDRPPNHDQLQAIVGGLCGLALEERNTSGARIVGKPPKREDGHWREGFIVLPLPPNRTATVRWLH